MAEVKVVRRLVNPARTAARNARIRRRKRNVSSIVTVHPLGNPKRRNRSKKIVVINKGATMRKVKRHNTTHHRNVVYRGRIKRGTYRYSSNPRRHRNPQRRKRVVARRRNPGFLSGGGTATKVFGVIGGVAVTKLLMGFVPASLSTGIIGYATTAAVAVLQGKLIGKMAKSTTLGTDMMVGGLAFLTAKMLNDFVPSLGHYTGISGLGLIGPSSYYVPQVNRNGSMGSFVLPAAVAGAIPPPAPPTTAHTGVGRLRRMGRVM